MSDCRKLSEGIDHSSQGLRCWSIFEAKGASEPKTVYGLRGVQVRSDPFQQGADVLGLALIDAVAMIWLNGHPRRIKSVACQCDICGILPIVYVAEKHRVEERIA